MSADSARSAEPVPQLLIAHEGEGRETDGPCSSQEVRGEYSVDVGIFERHTKGFGLLLVSIYTLR